MPSPTLPQEERVKHALRVTGDADGWGASHDSSRGTSAYCAIREGNDVVALVVARDPEPWSDPDPRPMAERIVQCVNAHDELLAALQRIAAVEPVDGKAAKNRGAMLHMQAIARAAIAKATGSAA